MGFEIIDCRKAGHKIATHPAISLQDYPDFNCGHKPGNKVKRIYIKKMYNFVATHKDAIEGYINEV